MTVGALYPMILAIQENGLPTNSVFKFNHKELLVVQKALNLLHQDNQNLEKLLYVSVLHR